MQRPLSCELFQRGQNGENAGNETESGIKTRCRTDDINKQNIRDDKYGWRDTRFFYKKVFYQKVNI